MSETKKKVLSIKVDEEVYAKFKAVCEDIGGQNEGLSALITVYELSTAKKLLSGQADSISNFQAKIDGVLHYDFSNAIKNPFASVLNENRTVTLDDDIIDYFVAMSDEKKIPYQTLINLYLTDCIKRHRQLSMSWD